MWLCEDKFKGKTAHFRLPSASQKRACLNSLLCFPNHARFLMTGFHAGANVVNLSLGIWMSFCAGL